MKKLSEAEGGKAVTNLSDIKADDIIAAGKMKAPPTPPKGPYGAEYPSAGGL